MRYHLEALREDAFLHLIRERAKTMWSTGGETARDLLSNASSCLLMLMRLFLIWWRHNLCNPSAPRWYTKVTFRVMKNNNKKDFQIKICGCFLARWLGPSCVSHPRAAKKTKSHHRAVCLSLFLADARAFFSCISFRHCHDSIDPMRWMEAEREKLKKQ